MRDASKPGMPKRELLELSEISLQYGTWGELGYGYKIVSNDDTDNFLLVPQADADQVANELTAIAALIRAHGPERKGP